MRPLISALRTLTILPLPGKDCEKFSHSLPFFPVVGGIIALLMWTVYRAIVLLISAEPNIVALVLITFGTVITGALHVDGLADSCDAFGGGRTKERVLEIMKDSRHGTFGVVAIVLSLGAKVLLVSALIQHQAIMIVLFSLILSRSFQALSLCFLPNARGAESIAAGFKASTVILLLAIVTALVATNVFFWMSGWMSALISIGIASIAVCGFLVYCVKRIGGITGDCVGAVNEISEIAILFGGLLCIVKGW